MEEKKYSFAQIRQIVKISAMPDMTLNQLFSTLDKVSDEAKLLQKKLSLIADKHDSLLKELRLHQSEKISLEKEVFTLKNRQLALMSQLRQDAESDMEESDWHMIN